MEELKSLFLKNIIIYEGYENFDTNSVLSVKIYKKFH
jgi:hypothetical protein